jgi:hypothetical protein
MSPRTPTTAPFRWIDPFDLPREEVMSTPPEGPGTPEVGPVVAPTTTQESPGAPSNQPAPAQDGGQ